MKGFFFRGTVRRYASLGTTSKEQAAQLQLDQIKSRMSALVDAFLDGMIDKDIYESKRLDLAIKQKYAEEELAKWHSPLSDKKAPLEELANLVANPGYAYSQANNIQKRILIESVMKNVLLFNDCIKWGWQTPFDSILATQNSPFRGESL